MGFYEGIMYEGFTCVYGKGRAHQSLCLGVLQERNLNAPYAATNATIATIAPFINLSLMSTNKDPATTNDTPPVAASKNACISNFLIWVRYPLLCPVLVLVRIAHDCDACHSAKNCPSRWPSPGRPPCFCCGRVYRPFLHFCPESGEATVKRNGRRRKRPHPASLSLFKWAVRSK